MQNMPVSGNRQMVSNRIDQYLRIIPADFTVQESSASFFMFCRGVFHDAILLAIGDQILQVVDVFRVANFSINPKLSDGAKPVW